MTNPELTLIAGLLDRSGSMKTCKEATETGWEELINEQKEQPGRALVTLCQFDTKYDTLYSNLPIHQLPRFELVPRGRTAMLDAVGKFITEIGEHLAGMPEDDRPGTVIAMIMTDGMENASHEWSWGQVRALITQQRETYGWKFLFLGSNIDAVQVGVDMGIDRGSSITFDSTNDAAVEGTYAVASAAMSYSRAGLNADFTDADRARTVGKKAAQ